MSEPITLYRDGDEVTIYAPSEVKRMMAEGWTLEPAESDGEVPFTLRNNYVDESKFVNISEPEPKPRRGRKPKGKA